MTCPLWPFTLTTVALGAKWGVCPQSSIKKHCRRNNRASECLPTGLFATTNFSHLCLEKLHRATRGRGLCRAGAATRGQRTVTCLGNRELAAAWSCSFF